jgi:hypothetical protein
MCDLVRPALWIGGAALAVALSCAAIIVLANAGSRNLALGIGALFGACILFLIQLFFELQGTSTTEDFGIEYDVDFQDGWIRKRPQTPTDGMSLFVSVEASKIVAATNPPLRFGQAAKITHDMAIFSLINYVLYYQADWQLNSSTFKSSIGTHSTWVGVSTPSECTKIDVPFIQSELRKADNMFAAAQLIGPSQSVLCLPPHSKLSITSNSVSLTSQVCDISFSFKDPYVRMSTFAPGPPNVSSPLLGDGTSRYVNVLHGASATITYFALRAQDRHLARYQSWAKRVVAGARQWFE